MDDSNNLDTTNTIKVCVPGEIHNIAIEGTLASTACPQIPHKDLEQGKQYRYTIYLRHHHSDDPFVDTATGKLAYISDKGWVIQDTLVGEYFLPANQYAVEFYDAIPEHVKLSNNLHRVARAVRDNLEETPQAYLSCLLEEGFIETTSHYDLVTSGIDFEKDE